MAISLAADALVAHKQPITDAELRATGDTSYPCPASGIMIMTCDWYRKFVPKNKEPPKSLKENGPRRGAEDGLRGELQHDLRCQESPL